MKVVTPKEMAQLESLAFQEGALEADFMEKAGRGIALRVHDYIQEHKLGKHLLLLCGKGNNAGDAYVAGVFLLHMGYEVQALQMVKIADCSPLCQHSYARFFSAHGIIIDEADLNEPFFASYDLIIDGLFGTGFRGQVNEPFSSAIHFANQSLRPIISIDIPSGLNGETGEVNNEAIQAVETTFLGLPKQGFFFRQGWNQTGRLVFIDFELPEKIVYSAKSSFLMLSSQMIRPLLPPVIRNRHKYQAGYVVGLAGSPEMPGAAMLASVASLKGGAGIVRLLHPKGMQNELALSAYEIIKTCYEINHPDKILDYLHQSSAAFIGPGLGKSKEAQQLLKTILPQLEIPCVIDADALDFLAKEEIQPPVNSILTPHLGEMMRLLKLTTTPAIDEELLKRCQDYAESKQITLLLKGGPSWIFHPQESIIVNPYGDPGMATAGSGDVLTGLLAALLAQGLRTRETAALGLFLHGFAGQCASDELTPYCMMASDIISHFPQAFRYLKEE